MAVLGLSKNGLILFVVGMAFGFSFTYIFSSTNMFSSIAPKKSNRHYPKLPAKPGEHMEMDDDENFQPDDSVSWHDTKSHAHAGNQLV